MLTELRKNIAELISQCPTRRPCAVRRSLSPDFLLAIDLPHAAEEATVEKFLHLAQENGWTASVENGWILLDHALPVPPAYADTAANGRLANAIWLLQHHPSDETDDAALRALAKAAEEGDKAVERFCDGCVKDWAVRLRMHQALPGALLPYLNYTASLLASRRNVR